MSPRRVASAVLMALLAAGCSTPGPTFTGPPGTATPLPTQAPSPTPMPATPTPGIAADPPPLALELVAQGLASPVSLAADAAGRLYVNEQAGRVVAIEPSGTLSVVVDLTDRVGAGATEQGLLGLALHPGWPGVGRAFVHYTDLAGHTVLSELTSADGLTLDPASERVILQVDQPYANHNGGQLTFGPDGYLYLALGDGGSGGDPHGHGQDPARCSARSCAWMCRALPATASRPTTRSPPAAVRPRR
ncbi:MAG: PQQ-dependent sugar dehydrogenase, partial [Candidatus Limnocylindria bacterium]